jgi:hypothetical protein
VAGYLCPIKSQSKGNGVEPTASLERLAGFLDPAEELASDDRLQPASQALARFEQYIRPAPNGCHLWSGSLTADGYGQFYLNGRLYLSRRLAYELTGGTIGIDERVFSTCGVRACVNSRHLETRPVATPMLPIDRFSVQWTQTEAGSWFLGLWTADGYLSRDANMSLALKDQDGVQLAAKALGLKGERVGLHRQLGQARIRVGVKWFLPRLAALRITPGPKTGRERAPLGLEHNRHFWRGVVDGDGWMSPGRRVVGLVTASSLLRDQFVEFLGAAIGRQPTISARNDGKLYQLTLTGSNAATLASLLYDGSTFALRRKRAAAIVVVEGDRCLRTRAENVVARNQRIIAAYADGCSAYEIAGREATSASTVYYVGPGGGGPAAEGMVCGAEAALQQGPSAGRTKYPDRTNWRSEMPNVRQRPRPRVGPGATEARSRSPRAHADSGAACSIKPPVERQSLRAAPP